MEASYLEDGAGGWEVACASQVSACLVRVVVVRVHQLLEQVRGSLTQQSR